MGGLGAVLSAAADGFLLLDGVFGKARTDKYSGWIPVTTFSCQGPIGRSAGTLLLARSADGVSPVLSLKCADGSRSASATLESTLTNTLGSGYILQLKMTNVVVLAVRDSQATASADVQEAVQLGFGGLQWTYTPIPGRKSTRGSVTELRPGSSSSESMITSPLVQSSGTLVRPGVLSLQWTVSPGKIHRLMESSRLEGPFHLVRVLENPPDGQLGSIELPVQAGNQFFRVEAE